MRFEGVNIGALILAGTTPALDIYHNIFTVHSTEKPFPLAVAWLGAQHFRVGILGVVLGASAFISSSSGHYNLQPVLQGRGWFFLEFCPLFLRVCVCCVVLCCSPVFWSASVAGSLRVRAAGFWSSFASGESGFHCFGIGVQRACSMLLPSSETPLCNKHPLPSGLGV